MGKDTLFICIIETRKHSNDSDKLKKTLGWNHYIYGFEK